MTRKLVVGNVPRKVLPPTTVRPPTQAGSAPSLDPLGWIEHGKITSGSATITYPTGVAGDMILMLLHETAPSTPGSGLCTDPVTEGWTEVFYFTVGSNNELGCALWALVSDGTESGSIDVTGMGSTGAYVATNRVISNGATLTAASIISNTAAALNPPAITLTGADDFLAINGLNFQTLGDTFTKTVPTGYTEVIDLADGSQDPSMHVSQRSITGTGTEDPTSWSSGTTGSSYRAGVWTLAIPADAAGASVAPASHTHVEADVTDLAHTDTDAIHDNVASEISAITAKGSPTSSDFLLIEDAADSNNKKSITIGDLPTGATDHGALTGLTDDDHTQYLLAAGTRAATYLEVSGLTGATASSPRFVGGTTSGAPASGTFALGDYVVTEDGNIYVCTTAGSPGSWTAVGAGAATDSDAIHDNVASEISAITEKTTLADADLFIIEDSAASNVKKRVQWSNVKGGGGGSISRVGRTTAGASWLAPSSNKYARKVTSLVSGDVVLSIGIYLRSTLANVAGAYAVGIFDDDTSGTSQPGTLLAVGSGVASADDLLFENNTERWFYAPLGAYIPATDNYWIAFWFQDPNNMQIAYDTTGGTAAQLSAGGGWWSEFGATGHSFTSQVYDISMHAVVLS